MDIPLCTAEDDNENHRQKRRKVEGSEISDSIAVVGEESFTRNSLKERVDSMKVKGRMGNLEAKDLKLAQALLKHHKQFESRTLVSIRFGYHSRFPGAECFIATWEEEEKEDPVSFKKVMDQLFPRKPKEPNGSQPSKPGPKPTNAANQDANQDASVEKKSAKYASVPPPPPSTSETSSKKGKKGDATDRTPWYERIQPGQILLVEGLGRIRPYQGGVSFKDLKACFHGSGRIDFIDMKDNEGRAYIRFQTLDDAQSSAKGSYSIEGKELEIHSLTGQAFDEYVAGSAAAFTRKYKPHNHSKAVP